VASISSYQQVMEAASSQVQLPTGHQVISNSSGQQGQLLQHQARCWSPINNLPTLKAHPIM
jgi:hypothetical protein